MRKKLIALLTCIAMVMAFSPAVFADDGSDAVVSPAPQADWQTAYGKYFADKTESHDFDTTVLKMAAKDINGDGIPEVFVNWGSNRQNVYTYAGGRVRALLGSKTKLGNDSVTGYFEKTGNVGVYNTEKASDRTSSFNVYKITDKGFKKTSSVTGYMHLSKKQAQKSHKNSKACKINGKKSTYTATKNKTSAYLKSMTKIRYQSFNTWENAAEYFKDEMGIDMTLPLLDDAGYTLTLPKETAAFNITAKAPVLYKDNGLTAAATVYTAEKDNVKLDCLFTVYKLKGAYDQKTLDKAEPLMVYLGTDGTYTYTYQAAEPEQTDINIRTFADLINNYVAHLENYITLSNTGYTLTLPKETAAFNITAKAPVPYKDNDLTGVATVYTASKGNAKLDTMFTLYRLKGVYDEKTLDKTQPLMIYLGTDGTYTYTYQIAEPEGTETDISTFADLMNSYIAHLGKYITLTDAVQ